MVNANEISRNIKNPVSITELCKELSGAELALLENQEILLTAVASYIYYECREDDHTIDSVIKVLNCIDYINYERCSFDFLFQGLRKRVAFHPAFAYYASFVLLSDLEKMELRDSCLLLLSKYSD